MSGMSIDSKDRRWIASEVFPEFCYALQEYRLGPVNEDNLCFECLWS
jgi:hypothetical protein